MQRLWLCPVGTVPLLLCTGDWGVLQPTASGDLKSANHRAAGCRPRRTHRNSGMCGPL